MFPLILYEKGCALNLRKNFDRRWLLRICFYGGQFISKRKNHNFFILWSREKLLMKLKLCLMFVSVGNQNCILDVFWTNNESTFMD